MVFITMTNLGLKYETWQKLHNSSNRVKESSSIVFNSTYCQNVGSVPVGRVINIVHLLMFSGYGLDDGLDCDEPFGADDSLSPLQKLEKYIESDNVYTR